MSTNPLKRGFDIMTSGMATALRAGMGINAVAATKKPQELLELYDMEACPYCRLVREVLTELDLDATIYPCPKGGRRFRPTVVAMGGKAQFPFLVDANTGQQMYESLDIVRYLFATYAGRPIPLKWQAGTLHKLGSLVTTLSRPWQGMAVRASRPPAQHLELYSFESSPFARLVRERLCELEIPYVLRSTGRSELRDWLPPPVRAALRIEPSSALANRTHLKDETGRVAIPYLVDPNTNVAMFESGAIVEYLDATYGAEA